MRVTDEGLSRGRRAGEGVAVQSKESLLSVMLIPPQNQEMVGQRRGKHWDVLSRG